jgi:hypothetical protein
MRSYEKEKTEAYSEGSQYCRHNPDARKPLLKMSRFRADLTETLARA